MVISLTKELTTKEAAQIAGYTTDHITLLLRQKKIVGQMRGRDWLVDEKSLREYIATEPKPGPKTA